MGPVPECVCTPLAQVANVHEHIHVVAITTQGRRGILESMRCCLEPFRSKLMMRFEGFAASLVRKSLVLLVEGLAVLLMVHGVHGSVCFGMWSLSVEGSPCLVELLVNCALKVRGCVENRLFVACGEW